MKWDRKTLESYLADKQERSVDVGEYIFIIKFINELRPKVVVDIGTYLGVSAKILGTCCDSIKHIYSIDNIDSPDYVPKPEARKEEHGKYLPLNAIFITTGYVDNLEKIINKFENKDEIFVFWDAGKNTFKILGFFDLAYRLGIRYIAVHDTNKKSVRRALIGSERLGLYKILKEDLKSNPKKGVSIIERI